MSSLSDQVKSLPVATRTGFAEIARGLIQSEESGELESPTDNASSEVPIPELSSSTSSRHTGSSIRSIGYARHSSRLKGARRSHKRDLLEPTKFDPSTRLRSHRTRLSSIASTKAEGPSHKADEDFDASIIQTEHSLSTRSEVSTAPTSFIEERPTSGTYVRVLISRGDPAPSGLNLPPQIEEYLKMDNPDTTKADETPTLGYISSSTPAVAKQSEHHDARMNSVYAQ